jgi:hypothetical protein
MNRKAALSKVNRLMGTANDVGPLMYACRRQAEYVHRGGHSPQTVRAWRKWVMAEARRRTAEMRATLA